MALELNGIRPLLRLALQEDLGTGDITSDALVPPRARARASFVMRQRAIVAGLPVAAMVFRMLSRRVAFKAFVRDGDAAVAGQHIACVEGPARAILKGERLSLNFLQRLSGIATLTHRCVTALRGRSIRIMDTRKTTPCWRTLEKYAVRMGGGTNHRMGLYDQVLIKDNHLRLAAAARQAHPVRWAVRQARAAAGPGGKIEVEADTVAQALEAVEGGADILMLDNMAGPKLRQVIKAIRRCGKAGRRVEIEVSGKVRLDNLLQAARAGPDRISLGLITHSAPAVDISLEFE
jgi:nicotinate-nucleotide pyrophosphorylase (carboxylating)